MGRGYELRCKKCGYDITAYLGVGFLFPDVYRKTMKAARVGKYGETIKQFLADHPDGTLNTELVLLQCSGCGHLKCGPDLSMYIRNPEVPREEHGFWCVAAPFDGADYVSPMELKEKNAYTFYAGGNVCEKCGQPIKSFTADDLDDMRWGNHDVNDPSGIACPECGEPLCFDGRVIMWD